MSSYKCLPSDKAENEAIRKYLAHRRAELRSKTKRVFPKITADVCTVGAYIARFDDINGLLPTSYAPSFDPSAPWWPDGLNAETIDLVTEEHDDVAQP
jgi:hypothetical protein